MSSSTQRQRERDFYELCYRCGHLPDQIRQAFAAKGWTMPPVAGAAAKKPSRELSVHNMRAAGWTEEEIEDSLQGKAFRYCKPRSEAAAQAPPKPVSRLAQQRPVIRGLALSYGELLRPGKSGECFRFEAGCFRESLQAGKCIAALVCHDAGKLLGTTAAGTLRLFDSSTGLRFEIDVPDASVGRQAMDDVRECRLRGASVCVTRTHSTPTTMQVGGQWRRVVNVHAAELHEVSLADRPRCTRTYCVIAAR